MNTIHGMVLGGIRVVDLSRVLAGPHCARLPADFGAGVVKAEAPESHENRRSTPYGQGANFASVNRGKRGLVLDLKNPSAAGVPPRLARDAAVLIHILLPDTPARA